MMYISNPDSVKTGTPRSSKSKLKSNKLSNSPISAKNFFFWQGCIVLIDFLCSVNCYCG